MRQPLPRALALALILSSGCSGKVVIPLPPDAASDYVVWLLEDSDGSGFATLPSEVLNFSREEFVSISQVELSSTPLCEGFVKDELRPVVLEGPIEGSNVQTWSLDGGDWVGADDLTFGLVPPTRLRPANNPRLAQLSSFPLMSGSAICTDLVAITPVDSSGRHEYLEFGEGTQTSTFCGSGVLDLNLRTGQARMLRIDRVGTPAEICKSGAPDTSNRVGHLSDDGSPDYAYQISPGNWRVTGCPNETLPSSARWLESRDGATFIVTATGLYRCSGDLQLVDSTIRAADTEWIATANSVYARPPGGPLTVPANTPSVLELTSCSDCQTIIGLRAYLDGVAVLAINPALERRVAWVDAQGNATPFVDVGLVGRMSPHDGFLLGLNSSGLQISLHPGW